MEATAATSGPGARQKPPAVQCPRLRPARTHRQAALKALPTIQQPLAEEVLKGGVRRASGHRSHERQGERRGHAEDQARAARRPRKSWHRRQGCRRHAPPRAAGIETVDLRDIRSVWSQPTEPPVTRPGRLLTNCEKASPTGRCRAQRLARRTGPTIAGAARSCSSPQQPPAEGRCPSIDMAERLATAASESLTSEVTSDRYATGIDAVAFSPSEPRSGPGRPTNPSDEFHQGRHQACAVSRRSQPCSVSGRPRPRARRPNAAASAQSAALRRPPSPPKPLFGCGEEE